MQVFSGNSPPNATAKFRRPCMKNIRLNDYSLTGRDAALAIEKGLAEATWYAPAVSKREIRELLERRDGPAIRDTLLWFGLIIALGVGGFMLWGTWWAVVPFLFYGVLYASTSDARWHECSHGTPFKTDWMNDALYEIASFMVLRESIPRRWTHTRHHSDTLIVGRDPEIAVRRPPRLFSMFLKLFGLNTIPAYVRQVLVHCTGRLTVDEKTYIPESDYGKVVLRARLYVLIYAGVAGLAVYCGSILPLMYVGLPAVYGVWFLPIYTHPQHAGLAENVLDHRLNSRTIYMNPINRFFYWHMNYHLEHHLFPLVPYYNLHRLHELVKADLPKPYSGLIEAWREIIPAVLRQVRDPAYYVRRELPTPSAAPTAKHIFTAKGRAVDGWVEICASGFLGKEDVIRFDHEEKTYAVYRTADGALYATDGVCTHGNTHLADGLLRGTLIECPKHNGRFDVTDGSPRRPPVCIGLKTYKTREHDGKIFIDPSSAGGSGLRATETTYQFRVVSNDNVATFIKELVLEPEADSPALEYRPGDYLQFEVPAYDEIRFREIAVAPPFAEIWASQGVFAFRAENPLPVRRNFSIANRPGTDERLRFNVRISTPPPGLECSAGVGSTYLHRLKPGDAIAAVGPFGSFHIQPGEGEMIYLGGGAGMAPLRSHLAHLFETERTARRVSFWYGARSLRESFYREYFAELAGRFPNFSFHLALSEPLPEDNWTGHTGLIHEVLFRQYLAAHPAPRDVDYYLCGPQAMIRAAVKMLTDLNVDRERIAFDEF